MSTYKQLYYLKHRERIRERQRKYYLKNADRIKKKVNDDKYNKRRTDPKYAEHLRQKARESYARRKLHCYLYMLNNVSGTKKHKARQRLFYAITHGKIKRPLHCEHCKKKCRPEGHHFMGYDYPLKVIWLCKICHCSMH